MARLFLDSEKIFFTGEEYEKIYIDINKSWDIPYSKLFILLATIGYRKNNMKKIEGKGREMRFSYLSKDEKVSIYCILLTDNELNVDIEDLKDESKFTEWKKRIEEYANGGMEILLKEIFPVGLDRHTTVKSYDKYIIDISNYVLNEIEKVPF